MRRVVADAGSIRVDASRVGHNRHSHNRHSIDVGIGAGR